MSKKPTHDLVAISGDGRTATFTRVAALWPKKDGGSGFTGEIPAGVTITGRIAILARKDQAEGDSESDF